MEAEFWQGVAYRHHWVHGKTLVGKEVVGRVLSYPGYQNPL